MQKNNWRVTIAIIGLLVCTALPQLVLYYKGYYFTTDAPAWLKYSLNAGCFMGVAYLGYWYLKQAAIAFLTILWCAAYIIGGVFIFGEYAYHFISPGWDAQVYLNTMGVFSMLVNPIPFVIVWMLVRVIRMLGKQNIQTPGS